MHHFYDALFNRSGGSLSGYFARVINTVTQATVAIYVDNAGTPIVQASGVANMAQSDDDGNFSFYVEPGTYHLDLYNPDAITFKKRIANVAMNSAQGDDGPPGASGPSNNTRVNLAALKAAAITDLSSIYDGSIWTWTLGNYTGLADDINIVKANSTALAVGAWVRQTAAGVVAQQSGTGAVARSVESKLRDTVSVKDFGAIGDGVANDTAAIQAAIDAAIEAHRRLVFPAGTYSSDALTVALTVGPDVGSFSIQGEGRVSTKIVRRSAGATPLFNIDHSDEIQTANFDLADMALFGANLGGDGIRVTGLGSCSFTRLWMREFNTAYDLRGSIASEIEYGYIAGNNIGIKARPTPSLSSGTNALTIRNSRVNDNVQFGLDLGRGSNYRLIESDVEGNGIPGNAGSGGLIVRTEIGDEVGSSVLSIDRTWFEDNKGRAIQFETVVSSKLFAQISNCNVLSTESGRAIYAAGGASIVLTNVIAPSTGDTFDITATNLAMRGCFVGVLSGTRAAELIETTIIGSAPVEGTHQRGIQIGGGYGLTVSWGSGAGAYKISGNATSGDLDVTQTTVGGTGVMNIGLNVNVPTGKGYKVSGIKVVGAQQSAIANIATTPTAANYNAVLDALRGHGLIAP